MIKIFLFFALLFFTACESPNSAKDENTSVEEKAPAIDDGTLTCVNEYYKNELEPRIQACKVCHTSSGVAAKTPLIFSDEVVLNQSTLLTYMLEHQNMILLKNTGVLDHQGGANFSDEDELAFKNFKSYSTNVPLCKLPSNSSLSPLASSQLSLMDYKSTAKKLISRVYNRDATEAELLPLASEEGFDNYLDTMLEDEGFYDFLMFEFNDVFQLDEYNNGRTTYVATDVYRWFEKYKDINTSQYNYIKKGISYANARQILELIAHVVKEERNLNEIVTADYILVNPFNAISWDINNSEYYDQNIYGNFVYDDSKPYSDYSWYDFKEVKIHVHGTIKSRLPDLEYYPHAGILNDIYFIKKYPTSGTNRNRHRARNVAKFFLGFQIEEIAVRSSGDLGTDNNYTIPTMQNPNCTVCHFVMDPIAGAYHNMYNTIGNQFYLPRFNTNGKGWYDINEKDMFPIGYNMSEPMPDAFRGNSLQWLGARMVQDPRFVDTMVRHFAKIILGRELLKHPTANTEDYNEQLQVYNLEQSIVKGIIEKFEASNRNAKVLIKELIMSPLFRAKSIDESETTLEVDSLIDDAHLITPERLDTKLNTLMETKKLNDFNSNSQWYYFLKTYNILYGGIDNQLESIRNDEMNAIKAGVQKKLAFDAGCQAMSIDLYYPKGQYSDKVLSPYVDINTTPESAEDIAKIKKNIQYLHKYLRGEELSLDSEELNFTYTLLKESYEDLKANAGDRMSGCSTYIYYQGTQQGTEFDKSRMLRTWSIIVNYLVDDFYFFYDLNKEEQ